MSRLLARFSVIDDISGLRAEYFTWVHFKTRILQFITFYYNSSNISRAMISGTGASGATGIFR